MARLELILISVLQFEALISGKIIYKRPGEDAVLPCAIASSFDPTCHLVSWLYNRVSSQNDSLVEIGNVNSSVPAARLSVDTKCSLVIKSVTAEDVGLYTCRQERGVSKNLYLNVLTISPSPPDADPKRDGKVTLECALSKHSDLGSCRQDSVRWLDETGAVLRAKCRGYSLPRQRKCVSVLTVKRQSGHNRRYTCQFVDSRAVEIEAEYTPDFTDSTGGSPLSYVMLTLRIGGLILMIAITVVVIRNRWIKETLDDDDKVSDDDGGVQYENVEAPRAAARLP